MKAFRYKVTFAELVEFESCLAKHSARRPAGLSAIAMNGSGTGATLMVPSSDLANFCAFATAELGAFSKRRLWRAATTYLRSHKLPTSLLEPVTPPRPLR